MKKLIFAVFAALGVLIYSNTFHASFVFDDYAAIVENPAIRDIRNLPLIWNAFNTRFFTGLSLAANYAVGRWDVFGYHLFNTSIHILNAFLVYLLTTLTLRTPAMSRQNISPRDTPFIGFFTGLVFLAHPIQTQAVSYVWQRSTSLAALFYLTSLLFYARSRIQFSWRDYTISILAACFGMFTKEIVLTLPFALGLYEYCFFDSSKGNKRERLMLLAPFFFLLPIIPITYLCAGSGAMKLLKPSLSPISWLDIFHGIDKNKIPLQDYLFTQINVLRTYLRLLVFPVNQNVDYDYPLSRTFWEPGTLASFLLLVVLLASGVVLLKKKPPLAFGIFWVFLTLSLESLLSQKEFIFEHRLYLPMAGVSFFAVYLVYGFFRKKGTKIMSLFLILVVIVCAALSYRRNFVWKDEINLWSDVIRKSPNKARAYVNRGSAYQRRGLLDLAFADFNRAVEVDPGHANAYNNRASLYGMKDALDAALRDCNQALRLDPNHASAFNNRGIIYKKRGELDQALSDFNQAIALDPNFAVSYQNRGSVYGMKGLLDPALADYDKAILLNPRFAISYHHRGYVYELKNLPDKATADYAKAKELGFVGEK